MLEYFQLVSKPLIFSKKKKHPIVASKYDDLLLHGPEELSEEYAHEEVNGALIYKTASEIKGAASPSNLDANEWHRILTSSFFGDNSQHLHLVKSVQVRSYFWSVFSCIQSEYRKIWTRNNSVFGHFSAVL